MAYDPRLILALDVPDRHSAELIIETLEDSVDFYKIGLQLLATEGMALAASLKSRGKKVFLDWKLHDIGATVEKATAALAKSQSGDFLTVHATPQVLAAAVQGRGDRSDLKILGVTVLTSLDDQDLVDQGYGLRVSELVERRIAQTITAGADGVVASPHEAALARSMAKSMGRADFLVITPGIRLGGHATHDQARAATPASAIRAGASHIVCGRSILEAKDPKSALYDIIADMQKA